MRIDYLIGNKNQKTRIMAFVTILLLLKNKELNQSEIKDQINKLNKEIKSQIKRLEGKKINSIDMDMVIEEKLNRLDEANSKILPSILFNHKYIDSGTMNTFGRLLFEWKLNEVSDTLISRVSKLLEDAQIIKKELKEGKRGATKKICSLKKDPIALLNILLLIDYVPWEELRIPSRIKKYFIDSDYGKVIVNTESIENWCKYMKMRFSKDEKKHLIRILKVFPTALETFLGELWIWKECNLNEQYEKFSKKFGWEVYYFEKDIYMPEFEGFPDKLEKIWRNNKKEFFERLLLDAGLDMRSCYSYPIHDDEYDKKNFYPKSSPCSYKIVVDWSDKSKNDERLYQVNSDRIELSF
jgi:hypothetical protein